MKVSFTLYHDKAFRKKWNTFTRNLHPKANTLFHKYLQQTRIDITKVTPMATGLLRDSLVVTDRGFLKVTFLSDAVDPRTGAHYSSYQHDREYNNYTTPGTGPKFIEEPFNRNSMQLYFDLLDLYGGNSPGRLSTYMKGG